jgi:hypothetical protein
MRFLLVLCLSVLAPWAHAANFVSLHQSALKIALPPAAGTYNYTFDSKIGFKQQYAPEGVTGCAIGYATGGCAFPGGGSLALPEFTNYQLQYKEFKVFIPAGTRSFMFSGYAPQRTEAAFALRYGAAPVREAALSAAEYANVQATEHIDTTFARLVNEPGADHLVVHDGGGTVRFVGGQLDANKGSTSQGNWLYIRQINGSPLYDVQGAIDVDMAQYAAGYAAITWTSSTYPDPVEGPSPAVGTSSTTDPQVSGQASAVATVSTAVLSTAGQPLQLGITLVQAAADVAANPKISAWVAARIPATGSTPDLWFFRKGDGTWTSQVPADTEGIAFASQVANAATLQFKPSLDFTETEMRAADVEVYFGYRAGSAAFVNKGKVWPQ